GKLGTLRRFLGVQFATAAPEAGGGEEAAGREDQSQRLVEAAGEVDALPDLVVLGAGHLDGGVGALDHVSEGGGGAAGGDVPGLLYLGGCGRVRQLLVLVNPLAVGQ